MLESIGRVGSLRRGILGLGETFGLSLALLALVMASSLATSSAAGFAGPTVPLVYLTAGFGSLCLASVIIRFTRRMASAGGLYTYTARGLDTQYRLHRRLALRVGLRRRDLVRPHHRVVLPLDRADGAHVDRPELVPVLLDPRRAADRLRAGRHPALDPDAARLREPRRAPARDPRLRDSRQGWGARREPPAVQLPQRRHCPRLLLRDGLRLHRLHRLRGGGFAR